MINTEKYTVKTEEFIGSFNEKEDIIGNVCDIVIYSEKFNIFIEQKINSYESDNEKTDLKQLARYDLVIDKNYKGKLNLKFFLTPKKIESTSSNSWINITHNEIIENCLTIFDEKNINETAKNNLLVFLTDLSIGPYFDFDIISYLHNLTDKILEKKEIKDIIQFKNIISQNNLLLKLISKY